MHFSLSTIATAALILSAEAAPQFGRFGGGRGGGGRNANCTDGVGGERGGRGGRFPTGGFPTGGFPGGGFPTGFPTGFPIPSRSRPAGLPSIGTEIPSGVPSGPAPTAPPSVPTGAPGELPSISFDFPSSIQFNNNAVAEDEESSAQQTSKTKKPKTKTSSAAEVSATGDAGEKPSATPSAAPPSETGSSGGNSSTPSIPSTGGKASSTFPEAAGESTLSEPMVITGEFDGGMKRFGRGVSCSGQSEGGDSDAVFQLEEGATLKNVIIGADQTEGVHCLGSCTIENVYWEAVCEDALTIKQESGTSKVIGGGAKGASDKVIQHNGGGTVSVSGFYVSDFGKLYRSCGNCKTMFERHVVLDGVLAEGGTSTAVGINTNFGDTATITNSCIKAKEICTEFEGNDTGAEPKKISSGPSASCIFTDADINAC